MLVTSQSSPSEENENISDSKQPYYNEEDENIVSPKNNSKFDYNIDGKTIE